MYTCVSVYGMQYMCLYGMCECLVAFVEGSDPTGAGVSVTIGGRQHFVHRVPNTEPANNPVSSFISADEHKQLDNQLEICLNRL